MNRYYFQVKDSNIFECIWAKSFIEAKQKAFYEYSSVWNKIEWLENPVLSFKTSATFPVLITE